MVIIIVLQVVNLIVSSANWNHLEKNEYDRKMCDKVSYADYLLGKYKLKNKPKDKKKC